jgi:uridine kinase
VYLTFQFTEHERDKKGTWKFNNRLLQDVEYIKILKDCIAEVIGQFKTEDNENMFDIKFSIDDQLFWETLKIMLRGKTISYSTCTFKKKERENIEFEL